MKSIDRWRGYSRRRAGGADHRRAADPDGAPIAARSRASAPDDLAAHVVAAAVERSGHRAGRGRRRLHGRREPGRARTTATSRGWRRCSPGCPVDTPGVTVNRLCASGLEAVNQASRALRLGEGDVYLAGGVESMSRAPWVLPKPEPGLPRGEQTIYDTTLGWRLINPRMAERYSTEAMGETAENVAERYGISREEQDEFALRSHQRAVAAARRGSLRRARSSPVEAPPERGRRAGHGRRGRGPARGQLAREARRSCGRSSARAARVTAGNASTLNDGAACLVVTSEEAAEELGARAAGPGRLVRGRRRRPRLHGDRPGPGRAAGARRRRASSSTTST